VNQFEDLNNILHGAISVAVLLTLIAVFVLVVTGTTLELKIQKKQPEPVYSPCQE